MLDDLDKAALLLAAAVHDLNHMGRTSSFLVNAEHSLALLYNDMSVSAAHARDLQACYFFAIRCSLSPPLCFTYILNSATLQESKF